MTESWPYTYKSLCANPVLGPKQERCHIDYSNRKLAALFTSSQPVTSDRWEERGRRREREKIITRLMHYVYSCSTLVYIFIEIEQR